MRRREKEFEALVKRLFPSPSFEDIEAAGERVLARLQSQMPEQVEAFRFRPDAIRVAETLAALDQVVLRALSLLDDGGDCRSTLRKTTEMSLARLSIAAVDSSVYRLLEKGLITSKYVAGAPDRYSRHLYKINTFGRHVLDELAPVDQALAELDNFPWSARIPRR
jgi:hypothetical protein